jgi:hypothetical protein
MLVSTHNGGVDHHVLVVVITRQFLENTFKNASLSPSAEALVNDLPITEALGQITPRNASSKSIQHRFDKQAIIGRGATDVPFAPREKILDPIPLVVA